MPKLIKDHVVFVDAYAVQLITLSGLRGTLHSDIPMPTLTFRSSLHPSSKPHHALHHPSSRAYGFSPPPLPQPYQHHSTEPEPPVSYPTLALLSSTPTNVTRARVDVIRSTRCFLSHSAKRITAVNATRDLLPRKKSGNILPKEATAP